MKATATARFAGAALVAAGLIWFVGEALSASAFRDYSYATNYISDLGIPDVGSFQGRAVDSPLHAVMNLTFVSQGVLLALGGLVLTRLMSGRSRRVLPVLAVAHGIGMILVGTIHGSQESVDSGIAAFHVIGAAMAIIAGNTLALTVGATPGQPLWYRVISAILGLLGLISLAMLVIDSSSTAVNVFPDGVWERAAVYAVIVWELVTGGRLLLGGRHTLDEAI